jgi:hypothetical protein
MALFAVLSKKLANRYPVNSLAPLLIWVATCTVLIPLMATPGSFAKLSNISFDNWLFLIAVAVFTVIPGAFSMLDLLSTRSVSESVSSLHLLPVMVTALIGAEKALGLAYMATPFEWIPIIVGSITVMSGVGVIWFCRQENEEFACHLSVNKTLVGILAIMAIAGVVWTGISLFYPYKISLISGSLDTGHHYETRFKSLRCSSLGGYALLLVAVVNLLTSIDLFKNRIDIKHVFSLTLFSVILLIATVLTGNTPIIIWFSDIPSDIQHGIGTPYASLTETMLTNIPWLAAIGFACFYVVFLAIYTIAAYRLQISHRSS